MCHLECKIRSASIFKEPSAARKFRLGILFPKIFCDLNFELGNPNRSICIRLHKHALKKALKQSKVENDISSILLKPTQPIKHLF